VGFTAVNIALYRQPGWVYEETRPVFAEVAAALRADPCAGGATLFVWDRYPVREFPRLRQYLAARYELTTVDGEWASTGAGTAARPVVRSGAAQGRHRKGRPCAPPALRAG
jgi:hypothetical protein